MSAPIPSVPPTPWDYETVSTCPTRFWLDRQQSPAESSSPRSEHPKRAYLLHLAQGHYPEGLALSAAPNSEQAVAETRLMLARYPDRPLFNLCFSVDGATVTVDILLPAGEDIWTLVEIIPSFRIREKALDTLARKIWVLERHGMEIHDAILRTIDPDFRLERADDYRSLFLDQHMLDRSRDFMERIPGKIAAEKTILAGPEPEIRMGTHCKAPEPCPYFSHCSSRSTLPEWPVTILPDGGWKKWARKGVTDLLALDESMMKPREAMIVAATRKAEPFHDEAGARLAMAQWNYPRAWIDFETASAAVPRWIGTQPYQQIPFQFSLHVEQADGTITHSEYLCCDGTDPREGCARALVDAVPKGATLIAYNAGFERGVLQRLARDVPDCADALLAMAERTVDLLPVTRRHWYHRDQRGSWSIKAVLPTVAELDYESLDVRGGAMAQESLLEAIDPTTTPERRRAIEEALRAYCMRDTWAMILIARRLTSDAGRDAG